MVIAIDREAMIHFAGGAVGGMTGSVVTYPLEVFKISAQSSNKPGVGPVSFIKMIVRNEGVSGLYKGVVPTLLGVVPSKAIYFWAYSTNKRFLDRWCHQVPSDFRHMASAFAAGFLTVTITDPIWMVKTRLQLHRGPLSPIDCTKRIYQQHGIRGFYKGLSSSYYGLTETTIQFFLYERLKQLLSLTDSTRKEKPHFLKYLLAGGTAKALSSLVAYPHEVVKTRLREEHSSHRGFWSTLLQVRRQDGWRSLYRGLTVQLVRSIPSSAITLSAYELVCHFLRE